MSQTRGLGSGRSPARFGRRGPSSSRLPTGGPRCRFSAVHPDRACEAGDADGRQDDAIGGCPSRPALSGFGALINTPVAISSTHLQASEPQVRPISVSDGAAPDLVDPIVGFRQWRLSEAALWSLYSGVRWSTTELRATCSPGRHDPTLAPSKGCSCGIYACYDPCPLMAPAGTPDFVAGAVVVWGRVEVHATGMRAEHARIVGPGTATDVWRQTTGARHRSRASQRPRRAAQSSCGRRNGSWAAT
jgi:hypothetical protein